MLTSEDVRDLVERMLKTSGLRVDLSSPFVDAALPDGSRLHVVIQDISREHWHDYVRRGTTSLFAALNTADGTVICSLHRRHRTIEFKKFLIKIDSLAPASLDVHQVCDNYGTHKSPAIRTWLTAHPRFTCTARRPTPAGSPRSSGGSPT